MYYRFRIQFVISHKVFEILSLEGSFHNMGAASLYNKILFQQQHQKKKTSGFLVQKCMRRNT